MAEPGISIERQTLFWIRDELWKASHTTVSVSPQEAKKMADQINDVLEGRAQPRLPRV